MNYILVKDCWLIERDGLTIAVMHYHQVGQGLQEQQEVVLDGLSPSCS